MATQGSVLPPFLQARLARLVAAGVSWRRCARELRVSLSTVAKYAPRRPARKAA